MSLTVLCFLYFLIGFFHPILIDYDLGRHLLFGEIMSQTHAVINTNLISYTNPNFAYVNSHWLSESIFYYISEFSGFNGLTVFTIIISFLSLGIIFIFSVKKFPLIACIITLSLYVGFFLERPDIRPEIFSYLFLAFFIVILYRFRENYTKTIFLLIPIEVLWVNLHINFAVGLILILLFLIDNLFSNRFRFNRSIQTLCLVFFLSLVSTLINPSLIKGALMPLTFFQNYAYQVEENQNIFTLTSIYGYKVTLGFIFSLSVLILMSFVNRKKTDLIDWLLIFVFGIVVFFAFRNISLFAYATFFTFAKATTGVSKNFSLNLRRYISGKMYSYLKSFGLLMLCLVLFVGIVRFVSVQGLGFGINENGKKAVDFLIKNRIKGPIYNNFNFGQYLAYRLYPKEKIFVDARPEAYPKEFFQKIYAPMQKNSIFFEKYADIYKFNAVVITTWDKTPYKNIILTYLFNNNGSSFALVYLDDYAAVFLKKNSGNKSLIEKFAISKDSFHLGKNQEALALVRYIFLFEKIDWKNQEVQAYKYLSLADPGNCFLRLYLSRLNINGTNLYIKPKFSNNCL